MTIDELRRVDLCILIPCYNNFTGLLASIKSIQYEKDSYVILVVDDGSLFTFSKEDVDKQLNNFNNIEILTLSNNLGITKALNKGLEYIYYNFNVKYIARLDCGDICRKDRFYKQVDFLNNNLTIHLIGTWCLFKETNSKKGYKYITPTESNKILRGMNFRNVFIHPTVMWRIKGVGEIMYPEQFPSAEDYGLFYFMITKVKSAIINEFLVTCEITAGGISIKNRNIQLQSRLKVISIYSTNKFFYLFGRLKLKMLMFIPYKLILNIKNIVFKNNF